MKGQPGRPMDVGPNWFLRDWIEGESELAKPIQFPEDAQDFRSQQEELAAALDAQTAAKQAAKDVVKQQKAEKLERFKRLQRAWSANSIGADNEKGPWISAATAGRFFIEPVIDVSPSKRYIKNSFLTSFWEGAGGHLPPHHQPNVNGVWNPFGGQNDVGKALGEFGSVPPHRQIPKEKAYAEAVEKRIQDARQHHSQEAVRATCGLHKRENLLTNAHPTSVHKGEKKAWMLERQMTKKYFSYVPEMVEPIVCDRVRAQVLAPVRAHDHARQIVGGSAVSASKWREPRTKYHGTQRREVSAKELLKNHHGPPQRAASQLEAGLADKSRPGSRPPTAEKGRPSTAPNLRRSASASSAGRACEGNDVIAASKTRPRSQSAVGSATKTSVDACKDGDSAPRPKSAIPGATKCDITVARPPSSLVRKPRPRSAAP